MWLAGWGCKSYVMVVTHQYVMFDLVVSREGSRGIHECLDLERMKERAAFGLLLWLVG